MQQMAVSRYSLAASCMSGEFDVFCDFAYRVDMNCDVM